MERLPYKQAYWDLQVLDTNNYVTADGTVHHNSGKSAGCVMALLKHAMEQEPDSRGVRPTRFAVIRNTYRMLQDTTLKTVFEWIPPGAAGTWKATKSTYFINFQMADGTRVESEWLFRALDTPDDAKNLLSLELTGAWVNEYREMNSDVFINLLGRVGRYPAKNKTVPPTWYGVIMDTNPPATSSYWYSFFEEGLSEEVQALLDEVAGGRPLAKLFKQPSGLADDAENIENLPPNYYATLLAMNQDKSPEWVKVHVHGEYGYVQDGLPVYPEFSAQVHVSDTPLNPLPGKKISIGMDFGLTPAAVMVQQNAHGQWLVHDEMVAENMGIERFAEKLLHFLRERFPDNKEYEVWADPAGQQRAQTDEKTCFQVLRAAGFTVRPGPSDLATRLGSVRRVLNRMVDGRPGMVIDPRAKTLVRGFQGEYRYRVIRGQTERYDEAPEKNAVSHVHDALNHMLGVFEGPAMQGRAPRKWGGAAAFAKPLKRGGFNVYGGRR